MNRYLKTIELNKILEMLAACAGNEESKAMIRALTPSSDVEVVRAEMNKTEAAFDISVKNGSAPSYNYKDIRPLLARARSGSSLTLKELLDISLMLRQISAIYDYRTEAQAEETVLDELFYSLTPLKYLDDKIRDTILSEDEIADTASPALGNIRRKIAQAGIRIRESLDKMLHSQEMSKALMENIVTIRDGRYVVPVRAEYKGSVRGIVHAASATGSTLFIEPESVVEANNDIRLLEAEEKAEIERIIAALSSEVGQNAESIERDYSTVSELLVYFAKASLGGKMKACVPVVTDDRSVCLIKARHPLLAQETAVPVDVTLGREYSTLIVTGPNTGGKTILLKTVGLLTAMTMCGMMIPASDGTAVSVFDNILVDIGDMQSIEESLSTFSSHMNNIVRIIEAAGSGSLVLLDELGGGTDPIEGAALAAAIIERLLSLGARSLVTTHYQELKVFALQTDGVQNASCEFDMKTLRPTYRLIVGSPGKSNAFSISAKLGVPKDIIECAKQKVSQSNVDFEAAVTQLEASRKAYDRQNTELARLRKEQEELVRKFEAEREELRASKETELEKARVQAMQIIENCRLQSDKLLDELAEIRKERNKEELERRSAAAKSSVRSTLGKMYDEANPVVRREVSEYKPPRPYHKGDRVQLADIGKSGILVSEPDSSGNVFVQIGTMKTKTNTSRLRLMDGAPEPEQPKTRKCSAVSRTGVTGNAARRPSMELDIRGYAVDDGILEVDSFIDGAVLQHAGFVTIIHGKGTGVLRDGIQRHLKNHPSVRSFRNGVYGEGENGVTVVELK